MTTGTGSTVPYASWVTCPNGHHIGYAAIGLSFRDPNWSRQLTWPKKIGDTDNTLTAPPLRDGSGERRCIQCGKLWFGQAGGKAVVNWTSEPPEQPAPEE